MRSAPIMTALCRTAQASPTVRKRVTGRLASLGIAAEEAHIDACIIRGDLVRRHAVLDPSADVVCRGDRGGEHRPQERYSAQGTGGADTTEDGGPGERAHHRKHA